MSPGQRPPRHQPLKLPTHQVLLGRRALIDARELLAHVRRVAAHVIVGAFELTDESGVVIDLVEQDGGRPDE